MKTLSHPALVELSPGFASAGPDDVVVVAFPPAGAGAGFYRFLPAHVPGVRVLAAQYPGRQTRFCTPALTRREGLVDEAQTALGAVLPAGARLVVLGHSLGAQIAFELALRLETDPRWRLARVVLSGRDLREDGDTVPAPTSGASDADLMAWLASLGGVPPEVLAEPELVALTATVLRADLAASRDAAPAGALSAPLLLLCGDADPVASPAGMDPWRGRSAGPAEALTLSGDHDAVRTAAAAWAPSMAALC